MAMACFRLLTRPPFPPRPERSVPCFRRRIALLTLLPAAFPYLGAAVRVASNPADFANRIQELLAGTDRYDSSLAISVARERSWERQVPRLNEWLIPQQNGKRRFCHDQRETANQDQNLITPDTGPTFA